MTRWASGIDTAWLQLERATNRMVVHGLFFCDGPVDLDAVRTRVQERWVDVYPGLRQRPTWPTGPVGLARWVDSPPDLTAHVTTRTLDAPGDDAALATLIGALLSQPLPVERPMWKVELITGYGGSGSAVHMAIHHGLADGVALNHLFHALADPVSDPRTPPAYGAPPQRAPRVHDLRLMGRHVGSRAAALGSFVRRSVTRRQGGDDAAGEVAATTRAMGTTVGLLARPPREERSALQGTVGMGKAVSWTREVDLGAVRAAGKEHGASVNDVVCAAIAGALREILDDEGAEVPRLRAVMPTNLRALDRPISDELGNEFGLVLPTLPTDEPDAGARVERMHRTMAAVKRTDQALLTFSGIAAAGLGAASWTQELVKRYAAAASLIISNVPGPVEELTVGDLRVRDLIFWVPCSGDLGLGVSVISYAGRIRLGVNADVGLMGGTGGVERFTRTLERALDQLLR